MALVYGVMPAISASTTLAARPSTRKASVRTKAARTGWCKRRLGTDRTRSVAKNGTFMLPINMLGLIISVILSILLLLLFSRYSDDIYDLLSVCIISFIFGIRNAF